ncbi:swr complex subunit [Fusarium chlamydosporum]
MPPDPLLDEEEQYASSEDSDFAPDDVLDQASDQSDIEDEKDEDNKATNKRNRPAVDEDAADAGYDNSGDEAIIKRGEKRRKKTEAKGVHEDEEGGEGGLIKTRRQRAAEKEERKYVANNEPVTIDIDALWAQMIAKTPAPGSKVNEADDADTNTDSKDKKAELIAQVTGSTDSVDPSAMIRIKRTYNFAGRVHTEEKLVARDSAEAKLYLASQGQDASSDSPEKRATRKAFRSAFEPQVDLMPQRSDLNLGMAARIKAGKEAQAKKLNVVEKSRMDWAGYVDKEGIKDELELAGKSKDSYMAREDFLAKSEALREEDSRRASLPAMAVLGKRKAKADPEPAISEEDAAAIFRRHFEAQFAPLPDAKEPKVSAKKTKRDEKSVGDDGDNGRGDSDSSEGDDNEDEDEWGGLSGEDSGEEEEEEQASAIEVVDHSAKQPSMPATMSKRELKAFMSSRPPDQTFTKPEPTPAATSSSTNDLPEDAPSLLAQDLELRRLIAESHLLAPALSASGTTITPKAFAAGRTRQKATDMRVQALGSKVSIHKQEKMPMNMRKGIVAAADEREAKRRREAKENGIILERETGKKKGRKDRRRDVAVDRPG